MYAATLSEIFSVRDNVTLITLMRDKSFRSESLTQDDLYELFGTRARSLSTPMIEIIDGLTDDGWTHD